MLEKKKALACPVEELFENILTEATMTPGSDTPNVTDPVVVPPSQPDPEVTAAFRKFVSERLTQRLATDPDFEGGARHPAARDTFGKK